jgi:hypothetical protein
MTMVPQVLLGLRGLANLGLPDQILRGCDLKRLMEDELGIEFHCCSKTFRQGARGRGRPHASAEPGRQALGAAPHRRGVAARDCQAHPHGEGGGFDNNLELGARPGAACRSGDVREFARRDAEVTRHTTAPCGDGHEFARQRDRQPDAAHAGPAPSGGHPDERA